MDLSTYDTKIANYESSIKDLLAEMEKSRESFINSTASFIKEFIQEYIESEVKKNAEHTTSLGIDVLRNLKQDLSELIIKIPDLVSKHIGPDSFWLHRLPWKDDFPYSIGKYSPEHNNPYKAIDRAIRDLMGYSTTLLVKYKYMNVAAHSSVHYRFIDEWSQHMSATFDKYSNQWDSLYKLHSDLEKVKEEKARSIASDLWEQA